MAETASTAQVEQKSRQEIAIERLNNKLERARTPGATVVQPTGTQTYELIHLVRELDRHVHVTVGNFMKADASVLPKMQKIVNNATKALEEAVTEMSAISGKAVRQFKSR